MFALQGFAPKISCLSGELAKLSLWKGYLNVPLQRFCCYVFYSYL